MRVNFSYFESLVELKMPVTENVIEPLSESSCNHGLVSGRGISTFDNDISFSTYQIASSFDNISMSSHSVLISKKAVIISPDFVGISLD